jgi:hypothetical protein
LQTYLGTRNCEELKDALGPYGLEKRNKKRGNLLQTCQSNRLCIMNTLFENPSDMLQVLFSDQITKCMLSMVSVSKILFRKVTEFRVINDGLWIDHSALRTKI